MTSEKSSQTLPKDMQGENDPYFETSVFKLLVFLLIETTKGCVSCDIKPIQVLPGTCCEGYGASNHSCLPAGYSLCDCIKYLMEFPPCGEQSNLEGKPQWLLAFCPPVWVVSEEWHLLGLIACMILRPNSLVYGWKIMTEWLYKILHRSRTKFLSFKFCNLMKITICLFCYKTLLHPPWKGWRTEKIYLIILFIVAQETLMFTGDHVSGRFCSFTHPLLLGKRVPMLSSWRHWQNTMCINFLLLHHKTPHIQQLKTNTHFLSHSFCRSEI